MPANRLELVIMYLQSVELVRICQPLVRANMGVGNMSFKFEEISRIRQKFLIFTIIPPRVTWSKTDFDSKSIVSFVTNFLYNIICYYETAIPKGTVLRKYVKEKNVLLFFKQARLMKF